MGGKVDDGGEDDTGDEFLVGMCFEFSTRNIDQGGNEAADDKEGDGVGLGLVCVNGLYP